ncbi:hypothetical protein KY285_010276 [Solanum tuberosum]|nr:hypothetical protein KY289_010817 [Solanum tuberosum]KAH0734569.1 hypothetical protein KY285_010276 [Solanum tuberosum]
MHIDLFTANVENISYARILIEVDVSQPLTEVISIETLSGLWEQQVEYEWRPRYCNECLRYGHTDSDCWYQQQEENGVNANTEPANIKEPIKKTRHTKMVWKVVVRKGNHSPDDVGTQQQQQCSHENEVQELSKDEQLMIDVNDQEYNLVHRREGKQAMQDTPMETKVKSLRAHRVMHKIARGRQTCNNYNETPNGRIWLMWENQLNVQIVEIRDQYIHCIIEDPRFQSKQSIGSKVYNKVDWALGDIQWLQMYGQVEVDFLHPSISDHSPILFKYCQQPNLHPRPFKFFINVMEHPKFKYVLQQVWATKNHEQTMENVWWKLKKLKAKLKDINTYMALYQQQLSLAR